MRKIRIFVNRHLITAMAQGVHGASMYSLHWCHNDHDGVSNHQPQECLLNRLFRRRSKKASKLRVTGLCVGNSPGPVNSPHKGPVTRKMFPFDDVIMGPKYKKTALITFMICVISIHSYHKPPQLISCAVYSHVNWKLVHIGIVYREYRHRDTNDPVVFYKLSPKQNGRYLADDISDTLSWMNILIQC